MKIVICGPPHSGKSVFIANLIDKLPTDEYTIIRACPDGEGTWSNNKNQNEIGAVRRKGKFTNEFIENACNAIDNQTNKIVLIDVGGVMSEENEKVFKHCDSFIVLSSDKDKKQEWLQFGQNLGLKCIGCIDSSLEGQEEVYSRTPYFQGKIVGLERGNILENSKVVMNIVADIIEKSGYLEKNKIIQQNDGIIIDDTKLGFELGYGKEIPIEDDKIIKKVTWTEGAIQDVYKYMLDKINAKTSKEPVKLNGIRANFILSAICKACKNLGVEDISAYDVRLKKYVPIRNLPQKRGIRKTEGLEFHTIENKENIFMDVDITKEQYSLDDYEKCILPKIKENKNMYLSGRMPLWLLASICTSYNSNRIFTFQPGKGFTCISSTEEKDLGIVVDGIDGINLNKYFSDKRKNMEEPKYLMKIEKHGIISKLHVILNSLKSKKENKQYLDETIIATKTKINTLNSKNNKFRKEIQFNSNNYDISNKRKKISQERGSIG